MQISERFAPLDVTIDAFFGKEESLLDAIKGKDLKKAYSCMQYVEEYYLVRRLALQAIKEGRSSISAVFVLPGGEGKYYRNFSENLPKWLKEVALSVMSYRSAASLPGHLCALSTH